MIRKPIGTSRVNSLELEVFRSWPMPTRIAGELYVDGSHFAYTCEDAERLGPKVPGQTAIPAGRYKLTLENSPKYGPGTPTINDVPGFTHIRIHAGNSEADTEGCLLVGYGLAPDRTITRSAPAVQDLRGMLAAFAGPKFITFHSKD